MDELEISGKRYISTRRAAKDHKYHSDYIGQLIRAGKVDGQKVGRSWYVAADSLADYLGKEGGVKMPVQKSQPPVVHISRTAAKELIEEAEPVEIKTSVAVKEMEREASPEAFESDDSEIVEDEFEKKEERHIPVKINKPAQIKKETSAAHVSRGSLRYVADDGPLYPREEFRPRAQVMPRSIEALEAVEPESETFIEEEPKTVLEKPKRSAFYGRGFVLRGGVVVAIGAATVGVVALASALIVSNTTIQGETASVSYSLGGM